MDKYDLHIEECLAAGSFVGWGQYRDLFEFAESPTDPCPNSGCLTMIRGSEWCAGGADGKPDHALTAEIRADTRLPTTYRVVPTRPMLEAFAEWQRRLDREVRGL